MRHLFAVAAFLVLGTVSAHTEGRPWPHAYPAQAAPATNSQDSAAASPPAKIDPAKEADIRKLLEVTGAKELALQTMGSMEKNIRPMLTASLPPGDYREQLIDLFFTKFHSRVQTQEIVEMAVPVYDKYFSDDEIKGLVQFYGTPLGHKTLQVLPKLMGELQDQGRNWGQRIGRESMEEVLTEHPELAKALEDAQKTKQPE